MFDFFLGMGLPREGLRQYSLGREYSSRLANVQAAKATFRLRLERTLFLLAPGSPLTHEGSSLRFTHYTGESPSDLVNYADQWWLVQGVILSESTGPKPGDYHRS